MAANKIESIQYELKSMGYQLKTPENGLYAEVSGLAYIETAQMCSILKGNELIVTTGCNLKDADDFLALVRMLKKHDCMGILLTTDLYIAAIPQDVLVYCNDTQLPIYTIKASRFSPLKMAHLSNIIYQDKTTYLELCDAFKYAIIASENEEKYLSMFKKNGYSVDTFFCVGVVDIFLYNSDTKQKTYLKNHMDTIRSFLQNEYKDIITIDVNNEFVFLMPGCEDYTARDVIMDVYHLIRSNNIEEYIYLGSSEKFQSLTDIFRAYKQADFVVSLKKKAVLRVPVIRFGSLNSYRLIASIEDETVLHKYYKEHLKPLLEYDALHKSSYFQLLETLIQNDFNVAETATKLFMHRNSVNYKLNKIESILHCSLSTIAGKSLVLETYKIWCYLYKEESIPDRRRRSPAVTFVSTASGNEHDEISLSVENCTR